MFFFLWDFYFCGRKFALFVIVFAIYKFSVLIFLGVLCGKKLLKRHPQCKQISAAKNTKISISIIELQLKIINGRF